MLGAEGIDRLLVCPAFLVLSGFAFGQFAVELGTTGLDEGEHALESVGAQFRVGGLALAVVMAPAVDMPIDTDAVVGAWEDGDQFHLLSPQAYAVEVFT